MATARVPSVVARRECGPCVVPMSRAGHDLGRAPRGTIRTAWESLVLLAHRFEPTRTRAHGRVNREHLAEIDLRWHDLRCEAACR